MTAHVLSTLLQALCSACVQILALTLLHIHTLPRGPLPLLCSREGGLTPV